MSPARNVLAAIVLAFVACSDVPVAPDTDLQPQFARGGPLIHSASGSGHITIAVIDAKRVFSFTAEERADGTLSGQVQLKIMASVLGSENPAITRSFQAEVVCLSVVGNRAWVGGAIKSSSIPNIIGKEVAWVVEDNGEGRSSGDLISVTQFPPQPPRLFRITRLA